MAERLFGIETEYALTGIDGKAGMDRCDLLRSLLTVARAQLMHLPDFFSEGIYLENGSRLYVDCGLHPEISTPECSTPWDAVRYVQAGDRILTCLTQHLAASVPDGTRIMAFRCNVDYGGTQATWGCHESYLHRADPKSVQSQMIPHLVTRVIYTGAGGFNPLTAGLEFTLSPRAAHIQHVVSADSTGNRGIVHTKDESLCGGDGGFHRLHILCGESLCSETAAFLKIGATALVVAMAEAGLSPGSPVRLATPLDALRTVAEDVRCHAALQLADGRRLRAIDIQRHYLAQAEGHLGDAFMPAWAGAVCTRWRTMLDRLEEAPETVADTLDWAIKLRLYADRACRRGISWTKFSFWNEVLGHLNTALQNAEHGGRRTSLDCLISRKKRVAGDLEKLEPILRSHEVEWSDLEAFVKLKREFYEIDTRFGELGDRGVFSVLDRAGVLAHRVPGIDQIEDAMANPPAIGRARIRGKAIRRLAGQNGHWGCDWQRIADPTQSQVLDLSDPFASEERWITPQTDQDESGPLPFGITGGDQYSLLRLLESIRRRSSPL